MNERDLSWRDRNRLYGRSMIGFFLAFVPAFIYFNYVLYDGGFSSIWDYLLFVSLFFFIPPYIAGILTFEILYSRAFKERFNIKRFVGRIIFLGEIVVSVLILIVVAEYSISSLIGELNAALAAMVLWTVFFFLAMNILRKRVAKLLDGNW